VIRSGLRDAIYAGEVAFTGRPRFRGGQYDVGNWRHRAGQVQDLPGRIARAILAKAEPHDERDDYAAGTREVGRLAGTLLGANLHRAFDEEGIRAYAENYSRLCGRMRSLEGRSSFALSLGIEPPAGKSIKREGAIARLDDPLWWRRQLRKRWTRAAEGAMRELGFVRKGREPYASDLTVRHRSAQKQRWRAFMERSQLVNELGEQLPLIEVAERSLANPRLRRGEFMCRVRGFEEIAEGLGHVAEFVTLTCPSAFHAQLAAGGGNPAYERATVREAQRWLCRMWARARAKLKRLSILLYGFRIAEPHHDATPHWHLLLFTREHQAETLRTVLRGIWLSEYRDESGAERYRAKFERIDSSRGSAVGYVAKYVSKNIDAAGSIGNDSDFETGASVGDGVCRVDAWAAVHGIRQFQQLGGPPVGLWREARRLRDPCEDTDLERARLRADAGDWCGFTQAVGGIHAGRKTNITLAKEETGEANRYGEARPAAIIGIRCASALALSRLHAWRIERRGVPCRSADSGGAACHPRAGRSSSPVSFPLGPVAITVRGAAAEGEPSGWSNPNETSQAGPHE
jgi:hypothetical protein